MLDDSYSDYEEKKKKKKKKKKLKLNEPEPNFTLRRSARKQKVPKSGGNYDMC